MKALRKRKRKVMSRRQPEKISSAEAWRNSQSDALAAYQANYKPGDPALSQIEINEIYGESQLQSDE
jgi:hypothetical protein